MRERALHLPRSVKKWGRRGSGITEGPLQPVLKIMVRQVVPLLPKVVHCEAEIQLLDLMLEQVDAQRRLGLPGKPTLEQVPGRTCRPMQSEAHT